MTRGPSIDTEKQSLKLPPVRGHKSESWYIRPTQVMPPKSGEETTVVSQRKEDETPSQVDLGFNRNKVLLACLFSLLTTQTLFLNVENVLPTYIPDHHKTISAINIAFILRYPALRT